MPARPLNVGLFSRMKNDPRHRWARPIVFEGIELPATAFAIDHLGKVPEVSEAASEWIWQFTNCAGVTKSDNSENVIRYAGELLEIASTFKERLLREMPARFDGPFDAQVLDDWVYSLRTMVWLAGSRPYCTWTSSHAG